MPPPEADPTRRRSDIGPAKKFLDRQPNTGLEEGLKERIAYFEGVVEALK